MAGGSIVDNQGCYGCHKVNKQVGGGRVGMSNMGEVCRIPPRYVVKVAVYFVAVMYFVVVGTRVCTPGIRLLWYIVKIHCMTNTLPSPCFFASLPFHPSLPPLCSVMGHYLEGPCGCLIKAQGNLKVLQWASRAPG